MSLRQVARDSAVYGASNAVNGAVGAVGALLLTRMLPPEDYAWIAIISTVVGLISTFGILSTNSGVQLYFFKPGLTDRENESAISSGAVVALISLVSTALLTLLVLGPLTSYTLLPAAFLMAGVVLAFFVTVSHFLQDLRRLRFQPWRFAVVATVGNSVAVGLGLLLVYVAGLGVPGYIAGLIAGALSAAVLGLTFARKDFATPPSREMGRSILTYSWPLAIAGGAAWLAASASVWILAAVASKDAVGQYAAAQMPGTGIALVVASVTAAWSPTIMSVWRESRVELDYLLRRFSVLWSAALASLSAIAAPVAIAFLSFWLPREYWAGIHASPLLILAAAVSGTTTFSMLGLTLMERTRLVAAASWFAALAALVLCFALVPLLGLMGAAVAGVLGQGLLTACAAILSHRALPIDLPWKTVVVIWGVATVSAVFCALSYDATAGTLPIWAWCVSAIAVVFVAGLGWMTLVKQKSDRERTSMA